MYRQNDGTDLEDDVHLVYTHIINQERGDGRRVVKRAKIPGRSGAHQEIDVFYEFQTGWQVHRIAIECKDHGRKIMLRHVNEFRGKLDDIGNVRGIIISRSGFQDGARKAAEYHGIRCLEAGELPRITDVITEIVHGLLIPAHDAVGEPFWVIIDPGKHPPTYHALAERGPGGEILIPLFVSRKHAEAAARFLVSAGSAWQVRGLRQQVLMALLPFFARNGGSFVCFFAPSQDGTTRWVGIPKSPEQIADEYLAQHAALTREYISKARAAPR